jgi:ABC-2 type transport system permease protein
MVIVFVTPVLLGIGAARCAPPAYYATALLTVAPFAVIPVAVGSAATLLLVNVFPARRARDLLMLMSLLFAAGIVLMLRFIQPERLLRVESLPDITDFFATLQSPITPLLPSFWAGETLFAGLQGSVDLLHGGALWTTAAAFTVLLGAAHERWQFSGYSRSQEAPKTRFTKLVIVDRIARMLPLTPVRRQLLVKDVKVFLRDVSQWVQLLPLLALVLLYLYNFSVLDLNRVPYMSGFIKSFYALVNLGMAGFVIATVAVRFVFPAVSGEGHAFWIVRTSPISLRDFLWSKFWIGLLPVLVLSEALTIASNRFLDVDPFLQIVAAVAIVFMTIALVGLATGLGARYPRFGADPTQAAGSYGGVAFMILAVLFILLMIGLVGGPSLLYLNRQVRGRALSNWDELRIAGGFTLAVVLSLVTWIGGMRFGVRGLESMRR